MNTWSFTNLTPHVVRIYSEDGKTLIAALPPSGEVARVDCTRVQTGFAGSIPVFRTVYGGVTGLPQGGEGDGLRAYVVSAMVRAALPHRRDLFSPGELIRDAAGQPIGCRGLDGNEPALV